MSKNQLKEHIEKIMSKTEYVLESPSYKAIIDDDFGAYDDPNEFMGGVNPVDGTSPLREVDPIPGEEEEESPLGDVEMEAIGGEEAPEETPVDDVPVDEPVDVAPEPVPTPEPEPERPDPDEIQNEIIKQNIDIMKQLNSKIENLEAGIDNLAMQNAELNKDVEEVREPTNVEKMVQRKDDSHPYYYGLNDMWEGNWFQARRDELGERGMRELEDGSYIADFDEMPQHNDQEIKDSFHK